MSRVKGIADQTEGSRPRMDALGSLRIERPSTAEYVANALREPILLGDIAPGTLLREAALAKSIGVSRNTVREALRGLAREGVVKHIPHRGVVVTRLVESDVVDIFRVRELIEVAAIDSSRTTGDDHFEGLRVSVRALGDAVHTGNWHEVINADLSFHEQLVGFLESPRIDALYQNIKSELRLCLAIADRDAADPSLLVAEHRELLDLLVRGDRRQCRKLLRSHLINAKELVTRVVRKEGEHDTDRGDS